MESAEPGGGRGPAASPEPPPADPRRGPSFWNETYWLAVISLAALVALLLMVPPRWSEITALLERERSLLREGAELRSREEVLTRAIESVENDPFYREAVYRRRLGVKRDSEVFLETAPPGPPGIPPAEGAGSSRPPAAAPGRTAGGSVAVHAGTARGE